MVYAEKFTNKHFMALPEAHQKFWIEGVMDVLGQIAAAKSNKQGKCVIEWYFGEKRAKRNGLIFASMEKYPDYPPATIFVALTERACGIYRK